MSELVDSALQLPPVLAYAVVAALVFGEAAVFIGFVLPGETAVVLGGVLASTGSLSLPVLLVVVVAAAILGDSVGYEVGRRFGPRVLGWPMLRRHGEKMDSARALLRKRGGFAVLLGRLTAFLRAVTPGLAGLSSMPYRRFLVFNAIGGLVWGVSFVLVGYFAGESYQRIETMLSRSSAVVVLAVVVAAILVWHRQRHRGHPTDSPASERQVLP